jgi:hypothetical protein
MNGIPLTCSLSWQASHVNAPRCVDHEYMAVYLGVQGYSRLKGVGDRVPAVYTNKPEQEYISYLISLEMELSVSSVIMLII